MSSNVYPTHPITLDATIPLFKKDLEDVHIIYDYDAKNPETGVPEKWQYEIWFSSSDRIVYAIHGGPMAGRVNFQTAGYQCIREGELWQVNWLEETGTICSMVYDITAVPAEGKKGKVTTLIAFSKGHWDNDKGSALGDKRNDPDFYRWHELSKEGTAIDRCLLQEQADVSHAFKGPGDKALYGLDPLVPIEHEWQTIFPPKDGPKLEH
ncbi:uncharacterized protein LY89DRAFT_753166 [Mollisia scopiformis]|uniref:Phenolic acid decarboxylase n=1 Tax=Mollisia scopiformis TaxID=149040 RepID=A0A194X1J5_MOLSC|nr:uncharacterized protein LY89DRAFT_753166 [Mollisia scopiformis]KUJ13854.1 hypothetical protein LY89DRAFT_753166 [Mollisia scopiformis]